MNKKNKTQKKPIICKIIISDFINNKKYLKIKINSFINVNRKIKKQIKKDIVQIDNYREFSIYLFKNGLYFKYE